MAVRRPPARAVGRRDHRGRRPARWANSSCTAPGRPSPTRWPSPAASASRPGTPSGPSSAPGSCWRSSCRCSAAGARALAWSAAVGVVLLTGFDRIALGVHFVSDVLAGWIAAGAVLAGTATAFGTWRGTRRRPGGLDPAGSGRLARTVSQPDS
ncbi:MAG: phosphatase PAP2 family protein [Mycobacteriales bacterium]